MIESSNMLTCMLLDNTRIFESYYKSTMLPNESNSNIAWIGSIQVFFMFSAGLVSGPLMDRYGPKVSSMCRNNEEEETGYADSRIVSM
jgi:MFS family permease